MNQDFIAVILLVFAFAMIAFFGYLMLGSTT